MGSANYAKSDAQALANKLIAVAEARQDAIAFISPYRGAAITDTTDQAAVNINSDADITDNVLSFYAPVTHPHTESSIVDISTCLIDLQTPLDMFL